MSDPKALLTALGDAEARFIIIGGVAMVIHGSSYVTEDLDILYERSEKNLEAIVRVLSSFNPRLRVSSEPFGLPFRFDVPTLGNGMNFSLATTAGDIDLFGEVAGVGRYEAAQKAAVRVCIDERSYEVLTLGALIRAKRAAGRLKDLQALPELEHLLEIQELQEQERANPSS